MTVKELYGRIDGDYASALKIMMMDSLIGRLIVKLESDSSCQKMLAAGETMDATALFESAHTMKGTCANLGLKKLSEMASEICEEFRPGKPRQMTDETAREKLEAIRLQYEKTLEGIRAFGGNP